MHDLNMIDVSIIIVNYKTPDLLCDCISSVCKETSGVNYEIIVVDNDSQDNSREIVTKRHPNIKWIQSDTNLGFGKANNLGIKSSTGKYLFFLNSDTYFLNNALYEFFEYAEKNEGYGALGAILLGTDKKPCHSYGNIITASSELKNLISKYIPFIKNEHITSPEFVDKPIDVGYITGADLWVPRDIYDRIGGFDPDYFMYCEEVDWQKRMKDKGLKRVIIPGPQIVHLEGGSDSSKTTKWSKSRFKNISTSRKIYHKKHFNKLILPFFNIAYNLLRMPMNLMYLKQK